MGFADKLKSLFVIEDGPKAEKKTEEKVAKKKVSPATGKKSHSVEVAESSEGRKGQVTNKFIEILFGSMEKHNLDGFDYLEFKESLKSLEKMPMDEQTRYQSAFAMAKTMGATPKKLMDAAAHYLKILQQEENKFEQALQNQRNRQIGGREKQVADLEKGILQRAEKIKTLTAEIEQAQKELEAIKAEISGAIVKVETTKNDFIASYNAVVTQIEQDVEKMKIFLK